MSSSAAIVHEVLEHVRRTEPGRYLTPEEEQVLRTEAPYLAARLDAMRAIQSREQEILKAVVEPVVKKFDFATRIPGGQDKCYRDVGSILRHCVFAMVCDDLAMLKNKLLLWLRTILQAVYFPGGLAPIEMTYGLLYRETQRRVDPAAAKLIEPFLRATMEILPSKEVPKT